MTVEVVSPWNVREAATSPCFEDGAGCPKSLRSKAVRIVNFATHDGRKQGSINDLRNNLRDQR
jgi:hypothetical protein